MEHADSGAVRCRRRSGARWSDGKARESGFLGAGRGLRVLRWLATPKRTESKATGEQQLSTLARLGRILSRRVCRCVSAPRPARRLCRAVTLEARAHWSRWLQWGGADEGDFRRATELALVGPGENRRKTVIFGITRGMVRMLKSSMFITEAGILRSCLTTTGRSIHPNN